MANAYGRPRVESGDQERYEKQVPNPQTQNASVLKTQTQEDSKHL